jgi:zinc transporter ZupT
MGLSYIAGIAVPLLAAIVGIAGAALGLWLTGLRQRVQMMVPLSAGVLLGVALFGLVPELAEQSGWMATGMLFLAGYGLLLAVNRFAYRVCPTCAHDHDHENCTSELHGFAGPLIAASALHAFLDGWAIATVQSGATLGLRVAVPLAVTLHKLPEGIALGGILRASMRSRAGAMGWCALAEGATLAGGVLGLVMSPHLGTQWILYPLGITAGWLFYLGHHAVHEEWKRRGALAACVSALTGMVGAAIIQRGAEAFFQ